MWHAMFPSRPEQLEPKVAALERWCQANGRDPHDIEWSVGIEPDALDHDAEHSADAYLEMGFTQFTLGVNGPDFELGPVKDWLAWRDDRNSAR
jgi:alkanesulfonate monooxygenase SsuD/methylene tetrahydromethanopterin reductase-like flavin-dependent oxidoreductase (luciferase family)